MWKEVIEILNAVASRGAKEEDWFDFKESHHKDNLELLHDVLCLANSPSKGDRFIIFGVSADGRISGISSQKQEHEFNDMLSKSDINRTISVSYAEFDYNGVKIGAMKIPFSRNQPFFLLKEKKKNQINLRAGVIYSRQGDKNTALDSTPSDDAIEVLWKRRFGLDMSGKCRFVYLLEHSVWEKHYPTEMETIWTAIEDPTYQIKDEPDERDRDFSEEWTRKFPDNRAFRHNVLLLINGQPIAMYTWVSVDGGRICVPMPKINTLGKSVSFFYYEEDSIEMKISKIIIDEGYYSFREFCEMAEITIE